MYAVISITLTDQSAHQDGNDAKKNLSSIEGMRMTKFQHLFQLHTVAHNNDLDGHDAFAL
jgi:hypothetical protein